MLCVCQKPQGNGKTNVSTYSNKSAMFFASFLVIKNTTQHRHDLLPPNNTLL